MCHLFRRCLVALLVLVATNSWARLIISPASLRVAFDGGRPNGTFTLTNAGDTTERYRAKAVFFRISEDGGLMLQPPDKHSLTPWIRFNPAEFELPPNSKRAVRYTITAPKNLEPGEYWGGIEFEPLKGAYSKFSDQDGRNYKIEVVTSALVAIFGTKGKVTAAVAAPSAQLARGEKGQLLELMLVNSGSAKLGLRGTYEVTDREHRSAVRGELPASMLLRDGSRRLRLPLSAELVPGSYELTLRLEAPELDGPVALSIPLQAD